MYAIHTLNSKITRKEFYECRFVLILQLSVIGTPAEEGSGGKIVLIKKGVFDDVDVAMMSHPAPNDLLKEEFTAIY